MKCFSLSPSGVLLSGLLLKDEGAQLSFSGMPSLLKLSLKQKQIKTAVFLLQREKKKKNQLTVLHFVLIVFVV